MFIVMEINAPSLLLHFPNLKRKRGSKLRRRQNCWNCLYLENLRILKVLSFVKSHCFMSCNFRSDLQYTLHRIEENFLWETLHLSCLLVYFRTVMTEICAAEKHSPFSGACFSNLSHLCCSYIGYNIQVSGSSVMACLTCIWEVTN
jgi:hypothetical protein